MFTSLFSEALTDENRLTIIKPRRRQIFAYLNHSLSHAIPPRGGPGNALAVAWQWQKASIRRLEITEARGQGKDTLTEKPLAPRV